MISLLSSALLMLSVAMVFGIVRSFRAVMALSRAEMQRSRATHMESCHLTKT